MAVEVIHGLSAVRLAVENKAAALIGASVALGKFLSLEKQPSQEGRIGRRFHYVCDMFFRDHQKMYRRLGVYVVESQKLFILVNLF